MKRYEVIWRAGDGYINSGSQYLFVDEYDLQNCKTKEDVVEVIEDIMIQEFNQNIYPYIDDEFTLEQIMEDLQISE